MVGRIHIFHLDQWVAARRQLQGINRMRRIAPVEEVTDAINRRHDKVGTLLPAGAGAGKDDLRHIG